MIGKKQETPEQAAARQAPAKTQEVAGSKCQKCGSPDRDMHPLTGRDDSEVRVCADSWHRSAAGTEQTATAEPPEDKPIGSSFVADVAYDFVRYYVDGRQGCSNCGGLPHTDTCFVGRFVVALALDYNRRGADRRAEAPAPQEDKR